MISYVDEQNERLRDLLDSLAKRLDASEHARAIVEDEHAQAEDQLHAVRAVLSNEVPRNHGMRFVLQRSHLANRCVFNTELSRFVLALDEWSKAQKPRRSFAGFLASCAADCVEGR